MKPFVLRPSAPLGKLLIRSKAVFALVSLVLCTCFAFPALAQRSVGAAPAGTPQRVSVLTMGPGDHPFTRFGHTALLLEWRGRTRVYNFGTFAFDGLQGVQDFLQGRFRYWLSVSSLEQTLAAYRSEHRTVVAQDLKLTSEQRRRLARALEKNARPENREYDYDYYTDNCTTRVRDALNHVLDGALERAFRHPGKRTFREHTRRLSAAEPWLYVALDVALGRHIDRVPDRYGELWVPDTLAAGLDEVVLERDGQRHPLVERTRVLVTATQPGPRSDSPRWLAGFALAGCALGGALAALGYAAAGRIGGLRSGARLWARRTLGATLSLVALSAGLLGVVLVVFWMTKHWATHQNWNVLLFAPWALPLVVGGIRLALAPADAVGGVARRIVRLLTGCLVPAVAGTLLARLPGIGQDNLGLTLFMIPSWLGLWWGALAMLPRTAPPLTGPHDPSRDGNPAAAG